MLLRVIQGYLEVLLRSPEPVLQPDQPHDRSGPLLRNSLCPARPCGARFLVEIDSQSPSGRKQRVIGDRTRANPDEQIRQQDDQSVQRMHCKEGRKEGKLLIPGSQLG